MRKIYLIGVFLFSAITLSAQTLLPKVEDIAVSRSGSKIIVEYTLSMEGCHWCKTELYLSTDGGKTFYSWRCVKSLYYFC